LRIGQGEVGLKKKRKTVLALLCSVGSCGLGERGSSSKKTKTHCSKVRKKGLRNEAHMDGPRVMGEKKEGLGESFLVDGPKVLGGWRKGSSKKKGSSLLLPGRGGALAEVGRLVCLLLTMKGVFQGEIGGSALVASRMPGFKGRERDIAQKNTG